MIDYDDTLSVDIGWLDAEIDLAGLRDEVRQVRRDRKAQKQARDHQREVQREAGVGTNRLGGIVDLSDEEQERLAQAMRDSSACQLCNEAESAHLVERLEHSSGFTIHNVRMCDECAEGIETE